MDCVRLGLGGDDGGGGDFGAKVAVAGRRTVCTRAGSGLEWIGLGQSMPGAVEFVLASVKLSDLGESGGVAVGLERRSDEGRLGGTPSASGEDFRGA